MRLLDRHAILGFEKQFHALDVLGDAPWWVDLDAGRIVFGGELEMTAGLLGTEAGGRFLWGWENPGNFPEPVVAAGREVSDALGDARISLDEVALVAAGVLGLDATFTGSLDEDVRVLLALGHPSLTLPAPETPRLTSVLAAVRQSGCVRDWPAALEAYAEQRGVTLSLDDEGRVTSITGRSQPG